MVKEVRQLLKELPERDWWGRQEIISALVARPGTEYIAYLEEGLRNHEDANVRNAVMEVYRALGPRALSSLASMIRDNDPEVRLFTVNILCEIRDKAALPLLIKALRDDDVNVRCAAAEALGSTGDGAALHALREALTDEPWVAMAALGALGEIGGAGALNALYECLDKGIYPEVATAAIAKAGDPGSMKRLIRCFSEPALREPALRATIRIAERAGVRPRPEYFIGLLPVLIEMLGSPDEEMKQYAFMALSWSAEIVALPFLLAGVRDHELQEYAIEGLLGIGRRAVCGIVDELKLSRGSHRPVLAKVLSMIGGAIALLQFAGDEDAEVRTEVALALGSIDMERAVSTLREMLSDEDEEVRLAARRSLSRAE
ncbi:MAG: HEAT repeat domain-containing protein [Nitrospiraceae bacterium]|nr:HEAT repeat domain-containing protein [Nitrospiraceae bacterium]